LKAAPLLLPTVPPARLPALLLARLRALLPARLPVLQQARWVLLVVLQALVLLVLLQVLLRALVPLRVLRPAPQLRVASLPRPHLPVCRLVPWVLSAPLLQPLPLQLPTTAAPPRTTDLSRADARCVDAKRGSGVLPGAFFVTMSPKQVGWSVPVGRARPARIDAHGIGANLLRRMDTPYNCPLSHTRALIVVEVLYRCKKPTHNKKQR
jgi:hypothetical protein